MRRLRCLTASRALVQSSSPCPKSTPRRTCSIRFGAALRGDVLPKHTVRAGGTGSQFPRRTCAVTGRAQPRDRFPAPIRRGTVKRGTRCARAHTHAQAEGLDLSYLTSVLVPLEALDEPDAPCAMPSPFRPFLVLAFSLLRSCRANGSVVLPVRLCVVLDLTPAFTATSFDITQMGCRRAVHSPGLRAPAGMPFLATCRRAPCRAPGAGARRSRGTRCPARRRRRRKRRGVTERAVHVPRPPAWWCWTRARRSAAWRASSRSIA